ncbi:hypothetical protein I633_21891 (plasmid) [Alteromonas mediterranea 615]|uniref:Uncharacterized protein n=1 Tax=Alteromonas mediterranea 615 TaxID=1300253 RepID=S5AIV4_9ALTE|nr:hypothetical protein I633_21891 [Alteromonas mediterranea 615]|tara:strand:- start:2134 stop:2388 length:255 start_codon:yes stop_codon:yes gene_type:complete
MRTRNTINFIIDKYKAAGATSIIPCNSVRFVSDFIGELPERWESYDRDKLIKAVREICELGVTKGKLKRKREKNSKGYIYLIIS